MAKEETAEMIVERRLDNETRVPARPDSESAKVSIERLNLRPSANQNNTERAPSLRSCFMQGWTSNTSPLLSLQRPASIRRTSSRYP